MALKKRPARKKLKSKREEPEKNIQQKAKKIAEKKPIIVEQVLPEKPQVIIEKPKEEPVIPNKITEFPVSGELYYSGFALTDNTSFTLFFIEEDFLFDNNIETSKIEFTFTENDMNLLFDRGSLLTGIVVDDNVLFGGYGYVNKKLYDWLIEKFKNCVFCPVTEFFEKDVNTLIAVLPDKFGKPIGVLKTT